MECQKSRTSVSAACRSPASTCIRTISASATRRASGDVAPPSRRPRRSPPELGPHRRSSIAHSRGAPGPPASTGSRPVPRRRRSGFLAAWPPARGDSREHEPSLATTPSKRSRHPAARRRPRCLCGRRPALVVLGAPIESGQPCCHRRDRGMPPDRVRVELREPSVECRVGTLVVQLLHVPCHELRGLVDQAARERMRHGLLDLAALAEPRTGPPMQAGERLGLLDPS